MQRKIVIGDIHGALKALEQLLSIIDVQTEDQIIFLGDYVDGWAQSADVIKYLLELEKHRQCIFIKGNHDEWCSSWLKGDPADADWLFHGGMSTVNSYLDYSADQKETHLNFFKRMKNYYVDDANNLFIHAGFSSIHGPSQEDDGSDCYWDRTLWETALIMDSGIKKNPNRYLERLLLYHEIYIGHTPTINYGKVVPMQACNVWNIDTGAAFYGKLSAIDVDTKKYWQSDTVQQLYPNEKGRNK